MKETLTRRDFTVTLFLNQDRSVDMNRMMTVTYPLYGKTITKEAYPSGDVDKKNRPQNYGTIGEQFKYAEAMQRLDRAVANALMPKDFRRIRESLTSPSDSDKKMTQTEFGDYLGGVPMRTIQDWEAAESRIPVTVVELLRDRGHL